jgi:hypothetical protein
MDDGHDGQEMQQWKTESVLMCYMATRIVTANMAWSTMVLFVRDLRQHLLEAYDMT